MLVVDAIGTVVRSDTLHGRTSVCVQNCNTKLLNLFYLFCCQAPYQQQINTHPLNY